MTGVTNNVAASRLEIQIDGNLAVAEYQQGHDTITFTHTRVPPELSGRGIGTQLILAGLKLAHERHLKVIPQCRFFAVYMQRHPETQELLSDEGRKLLQDKPGS